MDLCLKEFNVTHSNTLTTRCVLTRKVCVPKFIYLQDNCIYKTIYFIIKITALSVKPAYIQILI